MRVFVGEGSIDSSDIDTINAAKYIGKYLGENKITYIQGNCIKGLMGETYNEYKKYHNDIVMYGMDGDKYYEETKELLKDFSSRTMKLISQCDVAVFLPGGDCTIQEIATFNQYNREHPNSHKLVLVNINGFYDPLINLYENIINYGLNNGVNFKDNFIVVDTIEDAIKVMF